MRISYAVEESVHCLMPAQAQRGILTTLSNCLDEMNLTASTNSPLTPNAALGWSRLPATYAIPSTPPSPAEAREYCARLARTHYENFSVASWFLPRRLRQHFFNATPTAASPTTWATKSATLPPRSNCWTNGSANSTPVMKAPLNIRCL